jgi:hypothetical protein
MKPEPEPTQASVSEQRRAVLLDKLQVLLEDFAHLRAFDPEIEPVSTEWLVRSYADDRR